MLCNCIQGICVSNMYMKHEHTTIAIRQIVSDYMHLYMVTMVLLVFIGQPFNFASLHIK